MIDRIRSFLGACWLAMTGLTLAQLNALLGLASLLLGISYQIWKWRKEARAEGDE
jgi:hypothetical protein